MNKIKLDPMMYGRAKGTILVQKYLSNINPFIRVDLIYDIATWDKLKDNYDACSRIRPDSLIGDKPVRLEGSDGMLSSVPNMINEMKSINPNSVLLITKTKNEQIPRYEDDGGFTILFDIYKNIIIEFVGKGFDGRELTHGKSVHESYIIPWSEILNINDKNDLNSNKNIKKYITNQKDYLISRKERIDFLIKRCKYDKNVLNKKIPKKYVQINQNIVKQVLEDVVKVLYLQRRKLLDENLNNFCVQGNIINGKLEPWELFTIDRIIT